MHIFLIGFMGSGKSYLGRALAEALGIGFIDLDEVIENRAGMTIGDYFKQFGEPSFRQLESACLHETIKFDDHIISTGGGTPCFNNNMDWMNEHGTTIFLSAEVSLLVNRLGQESAKRPLIAQLSAEELTNFVSEKLEERLPFYNQAHLLFDTPAHGFNGLDVLAKYLKRFFQKKIDRV